MPIISTTRVCNVIGTGQKGTCSFADTVSRHTPMTTAAAILNARAGASCGHAVATSVRCIGVCMTRSCLHLPRSSCVSRDLQRLDLVGALHRLAPLDLVDVLHAFD